MVELKAGFTQATKFKLRGQISRNYEVGNSQRP